MRLLKLQIEEDVEIKRFTAFKIGGKIAKICYPETSIEFQEILQSEPEAFVAGNWSNTLVSSNGYNGVVISTSKLDKINISEELVVVGAGVKGPKLSQLVSEIGLSGLEFMIGFPGSIGGEVFMNAGANGQSVSDVFNSAKIYDGKKIIELNKSEMEFDYRNSICQKNNYAVIEAEFKLVHRDVNEIKQKMNANLEFRKSHQPSLALPNCGSIFKNPKNQSAGKLLDECGAKNFKVGGAKVWENHANFIVNYSNATSFDVIELMTMMKNCVKEKFNIKLIPEIRFLGNKEEGKLWEI